MGRVQRVTEETVPVFGPQPDWDAQSNAFTRQLLADLSGASNPVSQYPEPTGAPSHTTYADFGPLQGDFVAVRTSANKAAQRPGFGASLPSPSGGTIQDQLGTLGI